MIGSVVFAFAAGSVATVNPCGLALLPAYLARRLAVNDTPRSARDAIAHALAAGGAMTAGVLLILGIGGGLLALGARWLAGAVPWVGLVIGVVLAAAGLAVLAGRRIALPVSMAFTPGAGGRLRGDLLFGLGYGAVSLSCTLPIFLAVTGLALTGSALVSASSLIAYALGMGTVLSALAVSAALARGGLMSMAGALRPYVGRASGAIMLLSGLYVAYWWGSSLSAGALPMAGEITAIAQRASGLLRDQVSAIGGQSVLFGILLLLVAVALWTALRAPGTAPERPASNLQPPDPRQPGNDDGR